MQRSFSLISVLIRTAFALLMLSNCARTPEPTLQSLFEVNVSDGSGGGQYQVGNIVHIWADLSMPGRVFKEWVGDQQLLTDSHSAHTTFQMPAYKVEFKAIYAKTPAWMANQETIANRRVFYYFPEEPVGVITLYHGSGGDAAEWTETSAERRLFVNDAVAAGYGIIAAESLDRQNKQWNMNDSPGSNPDIQAIQNMLDTFIARGRMTNNTPIFGVGISQGARFVSLIAYHLKFRAVGIHCGTSEESIMKITTVPTIWCLAQHDLIIDNEDQPLPLHRLLEDRWISTALYINPPSPLYPLRFGRIKGLTPDDSRQIFSDLQSNRYLDQNNYLLNNPRTSGWEKDLSQDYPEIIIKAIREQLLVAYAEHEFFSDCDRKVLDFFNMQLR